MRRHWPLARLDFAGSDAHRPGVKIRSRTAWQRMAPSRCFRCWLLMAAASAWLGAPTASVAFPTWIGVYGGDVYHTDAQNPGVFTILMNQDYFGLHASVGLQVNGGTWTEYEMTYTGKVNQDSRWQFTPHTRFPEGAVVRYYFHGWDESGGNIWDNNSGADYSFTAVAPTPAYAALVQGVGQIAAPSWVPGPVFATTDAWTPIVAGDDDSSFPSTFALARTNGQGRVVALGHDGLFWTLYALDNGIFMERVVEWLDTFPRKAVRYTTGHGEAIQDFSGLSARMAPRGFTFAPLAGQITAAELNAASVLVIGNATQPFTATEIAAVESFVQAGGGLCLAGLGWSWEPYHPGTTIEDYPMTAMAAPHGVRWLRSVIYDPTDQYFGATVFHTFYPQAATVSVSRALSAILSAHAAHPTGLAAALETDAPLRSSFTTAHQTLWIPSAELPAGDPLRGTVHAFCTNLVTLHPSFYARSQTYSSSAQSVAAWARERFWRTWRDIALLTPERATQMANLGQVAGTRRNLLERYGLILADNQSLQQRELDFVAAYLDVIPRELHDLRCISVVDYLGARPPALNLDGLPGAVNVFGLAITAYSENSFPADSPPGFIDLFCAVLAHEVNHLVDAHGLRGNPALEARRLQLIAAAGSPSAHYLRSMLPDGFFASNPQEFFASIANEWFTDSALTLELGRQRFFGGVAHPINQALFFADVYSRGQRDTWFYRIDTNGLLRQVPVPLERDALGRITGLHHGGSTHTFTLNAAGDVVAIASGPSADTDGDGIPDWWTQRYFGHPTGHAGDHSRAGDDASGTGTPNRFKFVAGLDPTNSAAHFTFRLDQLQGRPTVTVGPLVGGRTYTVERTSGEITSAYQPWAAVTQQVGAASFALADTNAPAASRGYRLRVAVE